MMITRRWLCRLSLVFYPRAIDYKSCSQPRGIDFIVDWKLWPLDLWVERM